MKQFNEIIKKGKEILNFSFSHVYTTEGDKYFVGAYKGEGFYPFDMKRDGFGKWRVPESAPDWLKSIEKKLSDIIIRSTTSQSIDDQLAPGIPSS